MLISRQHSRGTNLKNPILDLNSWKKFVLHISEILEGPLKYQELRSGIRRALTRRFPYGIYFSIEGELVVIVAVLHTARDPAQWQRRVQ